MVKEIQYDSIKPNDNSLFLTKEETENLFVTSNGGQQHNLKSPSTPYDDYQPIKVPELSLIKTNGTNSTTSNRINKMTDWTMDLPQLQYQESENDSDN